VSYILDAERSIDCDHAFASYRRYLADNENIFPPSAYRLATSDWYFDPQKQGCPHDAKLDKFQIAESAGDKGDSISIIIRLRSAWQAGLIELSYPEVFRYELRLFENTGGHQDWRYDEFRVTTNGHVIHEIEWCGAKESGRWLIEATDVLHKWLPAPLSDEARLEKLA